MNSSILIIAVLVNFSIFAQKKNEYPKMTLELGAGYEYAHLNEFNENSIQTLRPQVHSGYSLLIRTPLHFSSAIRLAAMFNYRLFRKTEKTEVTSPQSDIESVSNKAAFNNFDGGLEATIFIDQFWKSRENARFNIGIYGSGAFVFSRYKNYLLYHQKNDDVTLELIESLQIPHWNSSIGIALRYNFNDSFVSSINLNAGYNFTNLKPEFGYDLNGPSARLLIGFGR